MVIQRLSLGNFELNFDSENGSDILFFSRIVLLLFCYERIGTVHELSTVWLLEVLSKI